MQNLDVISVNIWQILISLCNLLIIFLLFKKFLYARVRRFVDKRKANVDAQYERAQEAENAALADKKTYEDKLQTVKAETDEMIKDATVRADRRSEKIITDAKEEADGMIRQAQSEIELEKKKASDDIKHQIADVSTLVAEKMLEREIDSDDQRKFIDSFIEGIGDGNGSDK